MKIYLVHIITISLILVASSLCSCSDSGPVITLNTNPPTSSGSPIMIPDGPTSTGQESLITTKSKPLGCLLEVKTLYSQTKKESTIAVGVVVNVSDKELQDVVMELDYYSENGTYIRTDRSLPVSISPDETKTITINGEPDLGINHYNFSFKYASGEPIPYEYPRPPST
jgi:hypothetical protein